MSFAYKTVPVGMVSHGHKWRVGEWYEVKGDLVLCENGFHASKLLPDAFQYVTPGYVCKVEYSGEVIESDDKFVARRMRVVWAVRWTKRDSVRFCVSLKERMCKINSDPRVRKAFEAAEAYLRCPCKRTKDAARAAEIAARAAAWAAGAAAENAAGAAENAAGAAENAAGAAAWDAGAAGAAAENAAGAAERRRQHNTILRIVTEKRGGRG